MIAPAPVITAQPMIAVTSVGTSLGIGTTTRSDAIAYSAHVAAECETSFPPHEAIDCGRSLSVWLTSGSGVFELFRSTHVVITWLWWVNYANIKRAPPAMSPKCL